MKKPDFYYYRDYQEFVFDGYILFRIVDGKKIKILDLSEQRDAREFKVIDVKDYKNFSIVFLTWALDRNIICLNRDTNEIVWRIPTVKQIWSISKNAWSRIFIKEEEPDVVYCRSVDSYIVGFKIETGELVFEHIPDDPDPRDM
ncbi:MAG: hypothetical protein NDI69_16690 [Bacteriovoracaceae bacterium]|nr:hypothetical protein [Bacteriovoracaceae bacterium]